jgi:tripartite-type tricarboxylate transporter receptor subunit TctC
LFVPGLLVTLGTYKTGDKMSFTTRRGALGCALGIFLAWHGAVQAQSDWPSKPVRIIASFAPGGSSDLVARQLAQHLTAHFGRQFIVENRAGAGGNIGVDAVAKSPPDGYTLGLATSGPLANNRSMYASMPFDVEKDLTAIALVGEIPLVLAVNPELKATNLKELVALSKGKGPLSVAHPGNGTIGHLAAESLHLSNGANLRTVPYRGDSPAMLAVMSGTVDLVSAPVTSLMTNILADKLRAVAVTSKARFPGLPNVPTATEQGYALEATVWSAMVGPAGLPKSIVASLNQEINRYTSSPEGRAKLTSLGLTPLAGTPAQLSEKMAGEAAKWKRIVDAAKISVE